MSAPDRDVLTLADIALLADVTPQAVSNWRRRYSKFPEPVDKTATGRLFDGEQVRRWLSSAGKLPAEDHAAAVAAASALLDRPLSEDQQYALATLAVPALSAVPDSDRRTALERGDLRRIVTDAVMRAADRVGVFGEAYDRVMTLVDSLPEPVLAAVSVQAGDNQESTTAVDSLLKSSRTMAQYATPEPLRNLMVALAEPGSRVLDPCAGTGSLLATAATSAPTRVAVVGADIDPVQAIGAYLRLTAMNLDVHIRWADVLRQDPFDGPPFDTILIDPPLGARFRGPVNDARGTRARRVDDHEQGDAAWLDFAQRHLAPGGTAVVLTSSHLLTRSGVEAQNRRRLLASGMVDTIITLPSLSRAIPLPLAVWVLRDEPAKNSRVVLLDAQDGRSLWNRDQGAFAHQIVATRRAAQEGTAVTDGPIRAVAVDLPEILAPDAPVIPAYWIERYSRPSLEETWDRFDLGMNALAAARDHLTGLAQPNSFAIRQVPVDFDSLEHLRREMRIDQFGGIRRNTETDDNGPVRLIQAQHLRTWDDDGTPEVYVDAGEERLTRAGDVIFKAEGETAAIVDYEGGHAIEAPLIGLTIAPAETRTTPELLASWLSSPEVAALATGSTLRRINPKHIQVPLFDPEVAQALTRTLIDLNVQVAAAEALADALREIRTSTISAAAAGLVPTPTRAPEARSTT